MRTADKNIYSASERRALLILFFVLLGSYAYFIRYIGPNEIHRLSLTRSIVERGSLDIDPYIGSNKDRSYYAGHYYSDKAPGSFSVQSTWLLLALIPPFALPLLGFLAFRRVKGVLQSGEEPMPRSPPSGLSGMGGACAP
jgi:hypothetical protein